MKYSFFQFYFLQKARAAYQILVSRSCLLYQIQYFAEKQASKNPGIHMDSGIYLELLMRFERMTSSLPRMCSAN